MAITYSGRRTPLRLTMLTAVVAATLFAAGAGDARAHGTCGTEKQTPVKTSGGRIKATAATVCTATHAGVGICVTLTRDEGDQRIIASDEKCRARTGGAQRSPTTSTRGPCAQSGWYRTYAHGFAGNSDVISHAVLEYSAHVWINCGTADLANTAGPFEDVSDVIAMLGVTGT
jgi:hypothetical protein